MKAIKISKIRNIPNRWSCRFVGGSGTLWRGVVNVIWGSKPPLRPPHHRICHSHQILHQNLQKYLISKIIFVSAEYFNPIIRFWVFFNSLEVAECVLLKTEGEDHFKVKPSAVCRNFHQPRNKENEKMFFRHYLLFSYILCVHFSFCIILYIFEHFHESFHIYVSPLR